MTKPGWMPMRAAWACCLAFVAFATAVAHTHPNDGASVRNTPASQPQAAAMRQMEAARARTGALLAHASPAVRAWVTEQAKVQANGDPSPVAVAAAARGRFGNGLAGMDIDQLVQLVMMQTANDADQDLRDQMARIQAANQRKQALREYGQATRQNQAALQTRKGAAPGPARLDRAGALNDSSAPGDDKADASELSSEQQMKMQMLMDRRTKALEAMSNIEKKMSDTDSSIIGNLK